MNGFFLKRLLAGLVLALCLSPLLPAQGAPAAAQAAFAAASSAPGSSDEADPSGPASPLDENDEEKDGEDTHGGRAAPAVLPDHLKGSLAEQPALFLPSPSYRVPEAPPDASLA